MSYFAGQAKSRPRHRELGTKIRLRCHTCGHEWEYGGLSNYKATCSMCAHTVNIRKSIVKEVPKEDLTNIVKQFNMNLDVFIQAIKKGNSETKLELAEIFEYLIGECRYGA